MGHCNSKACASGETMGQCGSRDCKNSPKLNSHWAATHHQKPRYTRCVEPNSVSNAAAITAMAVMRLTKWAVASVTWAGLGK
jgi:hypothetical protein